MAQKTPTHKFTRTYIVTDPALIRSPQRIVDAMAPDGTLDRLGLKPVDAPGGPAAPPSAAAEQPASYVVDSSRFPNGSKPADPYEYINAKQCRAHLDEAVRPQGWIKNRYSYCQTYAFVRAAVECELIVRCRVKGYLVATPMLFGFGKIGPYKGTGSNRWASFTMRLNPKKISGAYRTEPATLSVKMSCKGYVNHRRNDAACHPGSRNGRTALVSTLRQNDKFVMDLVSDAKTPSTWAGPQIGVGVFKPLIDITIPGYEDIGSPHGREGGMRFDSAWYLAPNSPREQMGSVFDRARPGMSYDEDDDGVHDVAEHIRGARANPAATDPYAPGKRLAGATRDDPLRRLAPSAGQYQNDRYKANRYETRAFCTSPFMPEKPKNGKWECDEYPFASTYEGSARFRPQYDGKYHNWWSAAWVLKADNGEAGNRLGRWYTNDRILDNEPFFVPVV
ncbi:hypothetical protein [Streptomyces sp. I05A-00742]|uniref:NucA/NucB deoxyribonuclease domain-containing protein n=1 Tax=Streptomyces sp. I05A-00742 TaxID=2732853 RepID=UPI001488841E|nr:hypothetical protein [Streptomyces sp. I05A-00742]